MVAQWFGDLALPLQAGRDVQLCFGDGDFFILQEVELAPPYELAWSWRFLGIGPKDRIAWHITPAQAGAVVTVTDVEEERSREEGLHLREGWLDFTERLRAFLATSISQRYDWRRAFDGSIELFVSPEAAWERLFSESQQAKWLPFGDAVLATGAHFSLARETDADGRIGEVTWDVPRSVSFTITRNGWSGLTTCQVQLQPRNRGALLQVSQVGWETIHSVLEFQLQQRQRFCQHWILALKKGQQIVA